MSSDAQTVGQHASPVVETMQQLIIAFVLAMTFRGFVAEGFVIPTGSMAPTLAGRHLHITSSSTGTVFKSGLEASSVGPAGPDLFRRLIDPNLESVTPDKLRDTNNYMYPGSAVYDSEGQLTTRLGDRIFVFKLLYPFFEPARWDVVVFKNPTNPIGDSQNFIKRLIGLPGETIWLADGDVFTKRDDDDPYQVQRKPDFVQRAVWQPVHDTDAVVVDERSFMRQYGATGRPKPTSPWSGAGWSQDGRSLVCTSTGGATLAWNEQRFPITDWNHYNALNAGIQNSQRLRLSIWPVSDVRIAATITRDDAALDSRLILSARRHEFVFELDETTARISMRLADADDDDSARRVETAIDLPPAGAPMNVEFWHVDQQLVIFMNDERVLSMTYDWTAEERMRYATGLLDPRITMDDIFDRIRRADESLHSYRNTTDMPLLSPDLEWKFAGTPVRLQRVRVDRDLAYQYVGPSFMRAATTVRHAAYGTHPEVPAELGPEHFMMAGDNSPASSDSRMWGDPHPITAAQVDDAAFLVHRTLLLGKAWVVYFPSPQPRVPGGAKIIPDVGSVRFVR